MKKKDPIEHERIYFPTGSTLMDLAVGGGEAIGFGMGYEAGTIVRDWGGSGATKTFKACETLAASRHKFKDKFKWVYDDTELGNTFSEDMWGFKILPENKKDRTCSKTVERWEYNITKALETVAEDESLIYILDSLDGLSSDEMEARKAARHAKYDKDDEFEDGTFGGAAAKFLSQEGMRGLSARLAQKNALLYVISQERDNIGARAFQKKNRLGGGRAVTFYETSRVYSHMISEDLRNGLPYAAIIEIKAEKTRHPRPRASIFVPTIYDYGVDDVGANIDFLFDLRSERGELLKRAEKVKWDTEEPMDRDDLIDFIYKNKLVKELKARTIAEWEARYAAIATHRPPKYEDE